MTALKRVHPSNASGLATQAVDAETEIAARAIVADVRDNGVPALRGYAERFDGLKHGDPLVLERPAMQRALASISANDRELLERLADRIRQFARAQRASLTDMTVLIEGGSAGHTVLPMERAGCYAPAGRYPLPSSLLMTAVTARVAGVSQVIVATPRPGPLMLAAAAIADCDAVLAVGGAQAIAAMAWGVGTALCDVIVGPGNRWVTAAKKCVAGHVAIDMLAGPSELTVVADDSADAATVAADLIAQAEHDPDARVALVTESAAVIENVERELAIQLDALPDSGTARAALRHAFTVPCANRDEVVAVCNKLAPEHLQFSTRDADELARLCTNAGAIFVGEASAQVFGDYGWGGNHVLPSGRGARHTGGLSVLTFLRVRTWLRLDQPSAAIKDSAALARLEGLEGHAKAAERRIS